MGRGSSNTKVFRSSSDRERERERERETEKQRESEKKRDIESEKERQRMRESLPSIPAPTTTLHTFVLLFLEESPF